MNSVLVIGGGPGGMRAAEMASAGGCTTILCDGQGSFGRKLLIAGRGGLNLTHSEPVENFPDRYGAEEERWHELLNEFGPDQLQQWVRSLGLNTFVGSSGRVFPEDKKAAGLLRAWLERLRVNGVDLRTGKRFSSLEQSPDGWKAWFEDGSAVEANAIVLALGGASYPETGSDGQWPQILEKFGIEIAPWQPANCGWEVDWSPEFLAKAEGKPLKNLSVRVDRPDRVSPHRSDECEVGVAGELLITRYGLEGGPIYRLGPQLRAAMPDPAIVIDFKPQLSTDDLRRRVDGLTSREEWQGAWKLHPATQELLKTAAAAALGAAASDLEQAIAQVKNFRIALRHPRPVGEAISSAGGVKWSELNSNLMLRKMPGVFVAGEMIDWEAPTGGYLLQGCFATGSRAGRGAAEFVMRKTR